MPNARQTKKRTQQPKRRRVASHDDLFERRLIPQREASVGIDDEIVRVDVVPYTTELELRRVSIEVRANFVDGACRRVKRIDRLDAKNERAEPFEPSIVRHPIVAGREQSFGGVVTVDQCGDVKRRVAVLFVQSPQHLVAAQNQMRPAAIRTIEAQLAEIADSPDRAIHVGHVRRTRAERDDAACIARHDRLAAVTFKTRSDKETGLALVR